MSRYDEQIGGKLPPEICKRYNSVSGLSESENGETYLLRDTSDRKLILKIRKTKDKYRIDAEKRVIMALCESGVSVPRIIDSGEYSERCYLIREYVEGDTLDELFEDKGGFDEDELIHIGMAVCEQLSSLHEMTPPIIHRDIKPQNIVVNYIGEIELIDFDAARIYDDKKDRDTHFFGTEITAAPEQYGFEQTDARTDLYGLGKTLIYLACGSYDVAKLKNVKLSKGFKALLQKSVSMLKKERPKSADVFYRQLEKCDKRNKHRVGRILGSVAALICVATLAVTGWFDANDYMKSRIVEFDSPLLEKAVRQSLNVDYEVPVTYKDLERVTEIKILGSEVIGRDETRDYVYLLNNTLQYEESGEFDKKGDISDLSLLKEMPNLRTLYLANQNISDITPLKDLQLTTLVLSDNSISDFSCLSDMPTLRKLYIGNNLISNLEFMRGNKTLKTLNINCNTVESLSPLENTALAELWIMDCAIIDNSYSPIREMEKLAILSMYNVTKEQIFEVKGNKNIQEINVFGMHGMDNLECFEGMDNLIYLQIVQDSIRSLDGLEKLTSLQHIILGVGVRDYSALEKNTNLSSIDIMGCYGLDYELVVKHPSIKRIYCTEKQYNEIMELYPDNDLIFEMM